MAFTMIGHQELAVKLIRSIKSFAKTNGYNQFTDFIDAYYKEGGVDITKAKAGTFKTLYSNISSERRMQIEILLTTLDSVLKSNYEPEKKDLLLNAIACYMYMSIDRSYDPKVSWKNYVFSFVTSATNSDLFILLGSTLAFTKENYPSLEQLYEMYSALEEFIRLATVNPDDPKLGYAAESYFSEERIEDFSSDFLEQLQATISRLKNAKSKGYDPKLYGKSAQSAQSLSAPEPLQYRPPSPLIVG